jgi:ferritin-like metal-binding protein YciE
MASKNSQMIFNKEDDIRNLHQLLDYDAKHFTAGEILLKRNLPAWIEKAYSIKLKSVLQRYFEIVVKHVELMEHFIAEEEIYSISLQHKIMHAFIEEANDKLAKCSDEEVRDAALLAIVQEINHFKISSYGTAAAFTKELGMDKASEIFWEAEINEKQIDDRLSQLAEHEINNRAKSPAE